MKIAILGKGRMGKMVDEIAPTMGHLIAEPDYADLFIDFSHHSLTLKHIRNAIELEKPIVIGTTGWEEQLDNAKELINKSTISALYSPNFSLGLQLFALLLKQAAHLFNDYDVAGVEYHHSAKLDAPSGTAKALASLIGLKQPFASVRCGTLTGRHEVLFDSPDDLITLSHEAHNRKGFARGAIKAGEWLLNKKGWYTLDDMLRNLYSAHHTV